MFKNNKNITLSLFFLIFISAGILPAQTIALRGGLNMSTFDASGGGFNNGNEYTPDYGYTIGVSLEVQMKSPSAFETGLLFEKRNFNFEPEREIAGEPTKFEGRVSMLYINIPANFKLYVSESRKGVFFLAGGYIGIGVSGTSDAEITYEDKILYDLSTINWGSDPVKDDLKRIDFGSFGFC